MNSLHFCQGLLCWCYFEPKAVLSKPCHQRRPVALSVCPGQPAGLLAHVTGGTSGVDTVKSDLVSTTFKEHLLLQLITRTLQSQYTTGCQSLLELSTGQSVVPCFLFRQLLPYEACVATSQGLRDINGYSRGIWAELRPPCSWHTDGMLSADIWNLSHSPLCRKGWGKNGNPRKSCSCDSTTLYIINPKHIRKKLNSTWDSV